MLNIAVCEDMQTDMMLIEKYISEYMQRTPFTLRTYSDGNELLQDLQKHNFDIIFMDIVLNDLCGVDLTMTINRIQPSAKVIYQSSNIEFFRIVYKTEHIFFLLKPIEPEDFFQAMGKAVKSLSNSYIVIKNKEKIRCDDIIYIELVNHDMVLYLKNGGYLSSRTKTKELLSQLPASFIRCHKSFIVNIDHITSYKTKKQFKTENGQIIPIGNKYSDEVNDRIIDCWGESIL